MATKPGILTDWPWTPLGNFKYLILMPWVMKSTYSYFAKMNHPQERDLFGFLIFPYLLWRMVHSQIWISLSRHRTAKGNNRIVDKGLEFDQVDRESNWDDNILLNGLLFYMANETLTGASNIPIWRTDGVIITTILHTSVVELLYYWLHRALHHHFLYTRYHSHHHSSIVTEPISSVIHPFAEHILYFSLFTIPLLTTYITNTASLASVYGYGNYIDFMNYMGHCNFELVPQWLFSFFPPLKYLMYTPTFHSLHHTQFRTNYSLFMPFYDFIYGTVDKSFDYVYKSSLKKSEELPVVVHLTHMTTLNSIYSLQVGFARLASKPYESRWYLWLMWPLTLWSMMVTWIYGRTFVVEGHRLNDIKLQTWVVPKYTRHYFLGAQNKSINKLIQKAIFEAEKKGVRVLSLGLLNQSEELNGYGGLYVNKYPHLKVKIVDGSNLAVAIILNNIPKGTTQVLLRGKTTKVAHIVAIALCQKGIKVVTPFEDEYIKLNNLIPADDSKSNLVLSKSYSHHIWLVGEGLTEEEQIKASKGTLFVPFSEFSPKKLRRDCLYHHIPAMLTPKSLENIHACENWLPRRAMSASRIAGIVHALEGWNEHDCGIYNFNNNFNFDTVWDSALRHGFRSLPISP